MARRRNEKSLSELALGITMIVVAITIFNPKLREQIFSTLTTIVSFIVLLGMFGGILYLIIQSRSAKVESASVPIRRSPLSRPADGYNGGPTLVFGSENQIQATGSTLTAKDKTELKAIYQQNITPTSQETHAEITSSNAEARTWDISILKEIEWKRFEQICTEYLRMAGYVAQETKVGADGGVDIHVRKPGEENFKGIVQCKAWNTYKVGVKPIRELFGIMAADRISTGIFITSGEFTSEAEEFAKGKINLVWGEKFINLIKKLPEDNQKQLLDVALDGDYRTPTCPQCDIKMVLRESKNGKNAGGQFWGCVKYPRCRQTLICKEV